MAAKVQINPLITVETREGLRRACQERGLAQGDIVELALGAFLHPVTAGETLQRFADQQAQLLEMVGDLQEMFLQCLAALRDVPVSEAHPTEKPKGAPPIATYEQMYGPIAPEPVPAPAPLAVQGASVRSSRLRRWLLREELA